MAPLTIGLTGGIAAGKSEALAAFERLGATTLSSDAVVHELLESEPLRGRLVERWGPEVLDDGRVNRARIGEAVLAASMNPRGVTLLGFELTRIYVVVWAIYGVLAGIAGVLLGMFLGVSSYSVGPLTASAF